MLMYFWKIVCQGYVPNFTDDQLARRFFRKPATIRRWRARWEAMGILLTSFRCQRTFYEVNVVALQAAIQAALDAEEACEIERKARQLEEKTRLFAEISQNLRKQWAEAHSSSDQNDRPEPIKLEGCKTSILLNQSLVPDEPGKGLVLGSSSLVINQGLRGGSSLSQATESSQVVADLIQKHPSVQNAQQDSVDLIEDKMRPWMIEAARRLVEHGGQRWNHNLRQLLDGLTTMAIVRAVSSLWEQTQKGNVREPAKFLTRAVQRKYSCTKKWVLPAELPPLPIGVVPIASSSSCAPLFPDWLPVWVIQLLEKLSQEGHQLSRYELVDGGLQVWNEGNVQFFPRSSSLH